jgi:hypothetical protein
MPHHNTIFTIRDRVAATLFYMMQGTGYNAVAGFFGMGKSSVCRYISDVMFVVIKEYKNSTIYLPYNDHEWQAVTIYLCVLRFQRLVLILHLFACNASNLERIRYHQRNLCPNLLALRVTFGGFETFSVNSATMMEEQLDNFLRPSYPVTVIIAFCCDIKYHG